MKYLILSMLLMGQVSFAEAPKEEFTNLMEQSIKEGFIALEEQEREADLEKNRADLISGVHNQMSRLLFDFERETIAKINSGLYDATAEIELESFRQQTQYTFYFLLPKHTCRVVAYDFEPFTDSDETDTLHYNTTCLGLTPETVDLQSTGRGFRSIDLRQVSGRFKDDVIK